MNVALEVILTRKMPVIDWDEVDESEKPNVEVIWFQLVGLSQGVREFEAAVTLVDFCDPQIVRGNIDPYVGWKNVAGRGTAVALWNFMCAGQAVKANLDRSPEFRSKAKVNVGAIDDALRRFRAAFPDTKAVRDAEGHKSEMVRTAKMLSENATKPFEALGIKSESENSNRFMSNFSGRTFFTTGFGGEQVKFDLTEAALNELASITEQIYDAFPRALPRVPQPA